MLHVDINTTVGGGWMIDDMVPGGAPAVPEPASCTLLALAVGGIGATLRKRRKQ